MACGTKIHDRYIMLNQEVWEDYMCYYNVAHVLEEIFGVEDVFGEVFCRMNNDTTDRQELVSAISMDEIYEEIGVKRE